MRNSIERKLTIRSDDPFASMFLNEEERQQQLIGDKNMKQKIDSLIMKQNAELLRKSSESNVSNSINDQSNSKNERYDTMMKGIGSDIAQRLLKNSSFEDVEEEEVKGLPWQTPAYWQLSENRRIAIDNAKQKEKHSDFWYQLQTLNDKIVVFRSMYYEKLPQHEQKYYKRKEEKQIKIENDKRAQKEKVKSDLESIHLKIQSDLRKKVQKEYDQGIQIKIKNKIAVDLRKKRNEDERQIRKHSSLGEKLVNSIVRVKRANSVLNSMGAGSNVSTNENTSADQVSVKTFQTFDNRDKANFKIDTQPEIQKIQEDDNELIESPNKITEQDKDVDKASNCSSPIPKPTSFLEINNHAQSQVQTGLKPQRINQNQKSSDKKFMSESNELIDRYNNYSQSIQFKSIDFAQNMRYSNKLQSRLINENQQLQRAQNEMKLVERDIDQIKNKRKKSPYKDKPKLKLNPGFRKSGNRNLIKLDDQMQQSANLVSNLNVQPNYLIQPHRANSKLLPTTPKVQKVLQIKAENLSFTSYKNDLSLSKKQGDKQFVEHVRSFSNRDQHFAAVPHSLPLSPILKCYDRQFQPLDIQRNPAFYNSKVSNHAPKCFSNLSNY